MDNCGLYIFPLGAVTGDPLAVTLRCRLGNIFPTHDSSGGVADDNRLTDITQPAIKGVKEIKGTQLLAVILLASIGIWHAVDVESQIVICVVIAIYVCVNLCGCYLLCEFV